MTPTVLLTFTLVVVAVSGGLTLAESYGRQDLDDQVRLINCTKGPGKFTLIVTGIANLQDAGEFKVCCTSNSKFCRCPLIWKPASVMSQDADSVTLSTKKCRFQPVAIVKWGCATTGCQQCFPQ